MTSRIRVIGAGVAGLTVAYEFARAGCLVVVVERLPGPGQGCSYLAGGMIAPWVEAESAEPLIVDFGVESLRFWTETVPVAVKHGSLIVAPARDRPELTRFARKTREYERIDGAAIAALEPDLAGRFDEGLYFPGEAHLDPQEAIAALVDRLAAMDNVSLRYGVDAADVRDAADWVVDCRGIDGREAFTDLRGVKGEMLVLYTTEVKLARPVRLIHPRNPVYIVPRSNGRFMVGATMIENMEDGRITARSMMELLGAAYAIHPSFAEAEIIETGAGLRPAFPDNLPRIRIENRVIYVNGLYRHGFLLAPALARRVAAVALEGASVAEVMDADSGQRQHA
jgi:glycine oxidase